MVPHAGEPAARAWERATVVVAGTPRLPHDPRTEVVVATPPSPGR